jgi:ABC-type spermidine/putrescine transport system permease subunit II
VAGGHSAGQDGLIIAALFCFILSFGDFVAPYYLGGSKPPTLPILIIDTTKSGQQWPRAAVVAIMMMVTLFAVAFAALTPPIARGAAHEHRPRAYLVPARLCRRDLHVRVHADRVLADLLIQLAALPDHPARRVLDCSGTRPILADPDVWQAAATSIIVALSVPHCWRHSLGFCTAYSDYRYSFRFKGATWR